jgi:plastocyanin domain-containing protein
MAEQKDISRMNYLLVPLAALVIAGYGAFFYTGMPVDESASGGKGQMTASATAAKAGPEMTPAQMKMMIKNDPINGKSVMTDTGQAVTIKVDTGYSPNVIEVKKGLPLTMTFDRHSMFKCSKKVQFPALSTLMTVMPDDGKATVIVPIPAEAGQTIEFMCGMKMIKGKIVTVD